MNIVYKTIIVGGGIAGLSCAHELSEKSGDFLLITKDIGGRIKSSTNGEINYGALWVGSNYAHMNRYVKRKRKLNKRKICLYFEGKKTPILKVIFKYPWQLLKSLSLAIGFYFRYRRFQKNSEIIGQKQAIESDPILRKLYFQKAEELVAEHGIVDFARTVMEPLLYGIMTSKISEETAFQYQLMSLFMIVGAYEFSFDINKFTQPFQHKILTDEVTTIKKEDKLYSIQTISGRTLKAQNVVIATPSPIAQQLIGLSRINVGKDVYVFHLKGEIKKEYETGSVKFFGYETTPILGMAEEEDSSFLVYSLKKDIDLSQWFKKWEVIALVEWHPVYNDIGKVLLDAHEGKNLWLIGDENIIGLEDTFITGLYVAHKILHS